MWWARTKIYEWARTVDATTTTTKKGWHKIILREINFSTCTLFLQTKEGFSIRTAALYKHTLDIVNNVSWLHNKNVV